MCKIYEYIFKKTKLNNGEKITSSFVELFLIECKLKKT